MEYTLGNKKNQLEFPIKEEILTSEMIIKYSNPNNSNNNDKNTDRSKTENKNTQLTENKPIKKNYLVIKCQKKYSGIIKFTANNLNIVKFGKNFFTNFISLIKIDLSYNFLMKIPKSIFYLKYIKELNLEHNHINYLQYQLSNLTQLEFLNLSYNKLNQITNSIFKLKNLQTLLLNSNKINFIPVEIGFLRKLTKLDILNNLINELPSTLCYLTSLKEIEFEWFYILKKSFFLCETYEILEDDVIYEKCLKYFSNLFNKNILYCTKEMFFNIFKIKESLYNENFMLTTINNNIEEINIQKKYFFGELIKYIKTKDIPLVYKYANLILTNKYYKDDDFLSDSGMSPFHFLFSSFKQIKISSGIKHLNKNVTNLTDKDSMIINDNNRICSSRTNNNKLSSSSMKIISPINTIEENRIIAKSKIIANFLFGIFSNKIINHRSMDHWSAVHIGIRRGGIDCLRWIINKNKIMKENINLNNFERGSRITLTNSNNTINANSISKNISNKKFFNINIKGKEDWTPLHLAANLGMFDCVYLLLKNNAEIFIRNNNYKTPKQVTTISEINKLLTLYEKNLLNKKYNKDDKKSLKEVENKLSNKITKNISQKNPSRTNINFYKEVLITSESSFFEITEALNNLSLSLVNPINQKLINENDINKFFENTLKDLNYSSSSIQGKKTILIITSLNSIGISINNKYLMKIYQRLLSSPKMHISKIIKLEMISYIKIISTLNKIKVDLNFSKKKNFTAKNNYNKKKVNIINLNSNNKIKHPMQKKDYDENDSSNSVLIDSFDKLNAKNMKQNNINKRNKASANQNNDQNSANESCNIAESSFSCSGIESIGAGKIKYNK